MARKRLGAPWLEAPQPSKPVFACGGSACGLLSNPVSRGQPVKSPRFRLTPLRFRRAAPVRAAPRAQLFHLCRPGCRRRVNVYLFRALTCRDPSASSYIILPACAYFLLHVDFLATDDDLLFSIVQHIAICSAMIGKIQSDEACANPSSPYRIL